jgi:hypothetical protein
MLKFATKLALSLAVLGASISPTLAGPPKGMKTGPSMGSSQGSLSSSFKPNISRPALNSTPNLGGVKSLGNFQRFESGKINLAGKVTSNPTLGIKPIREIKPLKPIDPVFSVGGNKPNLPSKGIDPLLGNVGIKPIKLLDPGFGNGKPIVDNGKTIKPFPIKPIGPVKDIHLGNSSKNCWPNNSCGTNSWWGSGGLFGGLFGSTPNHGCGTYNPGHCHNWYRYCPTYCPPVIIESTPIISTTIIEVAPPVVPVTVNMVPPAPAGAVDLVIEGIFLLDFGDTNKNLGPVIRVVVANKGTAPAGQFALGVFASLQEMPSNEMIPAGEMLDGLAPGMSRPVDVRLPIDVFAMSVPNSPAKEPFKQLFIVADVENSVVEGNKQNNILPVKRDQLRMQ